MAVPLADLNRRAFLRRSGALSIMGAAAPWAMNLATLAEASAATRSDDGYKALVCVFLQGGNDHANTLVSYDADSHWLYEQARASLAIPRAELAPTALSPLAGQPSLPGSRQLAMAPALHALKPVFDAGQLAWLLNIGPLVRPTTLASFQRGEALPPKLFSHNDQQAVWQSYETEGGTSGWGGRLGDQMAELYNTTESQAAFTCVNVSGQSVFLSGDTVLPYAMAADGPAALSAGADLYGSAAATQAFRQLTMASSHPHLMGAAHAGVMRRAVERQAVLSQALTSEVPAGFAENSLAKQLQMVVRMIKARGALGLRRQVFFVSLGGFDMHDRLMIDLPSRLAAVGGALRAFHDATVALGLADRVTTFSASDFGRTLSSNGDGSDHGWGSHHLVMGGAVRGGRFFGELPHAGVGPANPNDVGQGRLLPTLAVDQLAASLARWMGVSAADLGLLAPRLGSFDSAALRDLLPVAV